MPKAIYTVERPLPVAVSKRRLVALLAAIIALPLILTACVTGPDPAAAAKLETRDWGVPPTDQYRERYNHAPTPLSVPGARTISTNELAELLTAPESERPLVIDVIGGDSTRSIKTLPGTIWLPRAGFAGPSFTEEREQQFAAKLASLTSGQIERPIVFLCLGPECWLSYNASLRAVKLGYSNVLWYRGGHEAWQLAGRSFVEAGAAPW